MCDNYNPRKLAKIVPTCVQNERREVDETKITARGRRPKRTRNDDVI